MALRSKASLSEPWDRAQGLIMHHLHSPSDYNKDECDKSGCAAADGADGGGAAFDHHLCRQL